jgi:hypothetical protein
MLQNIPYVRLRILTALCLVSVFIGAQKIETVNGVRVVHNEKGGRWGANPEVKLELVRTIGGLDAEENLSFKEPSDIVQDSVGNLYLLDTGSNRIQKLNSEGKFIKTIGRRGQGPGEFQAATSMDIDKDNNLFVFDIGSRRIDVLSSEGKPLRTIKFHTVPPGRIRLLENGLIVKGGYLGSGVLMGWQKKLPKLLEILDLKGKTKLTFGEAKDYGDGNTNWNANLLELDTDAEKNICLSFRSQNRIEKYTPDGKLLWQADRPLNYGTDVIEKGFIRHGRESVGIMQPRMNTVSSGVAADGKGRIWVITLRRQLTKDEMGLRTSITSDAGGVFRKVTEPKVVKGDIYKLEIFSPDGILLGEIPVSHNAHGIRIFGDKLFIREYDNTIFYQYKIVENKSHKMS